jgi:hypothetical protein
MHAIALLAAPQNDNDHRADPEVVADANALSDFIADAMPGASIAYYLGALARDRYPHLSDLPEQRRAELNVLADYALSLAEAGWVHLLQRRLGHERFAYLVVIRPRSRVTRHHELPRLQVVDLAEAA